ncbi:MAG: S1C family serine protease, partial [Caulobacteraceae bacterium]
MAVTRSHVFVGALAGAGIAAAAMAGAGMRPPAMPFGGHLINASTLPDLPSTPGAPLSFADIFAKVSPAVVSIDVTSRAPVTSLQGIPGFENFPFNIVPKGQGDQGVPRGGDGAPQLGPKQLSAGSGFFISPDGYIVTNNHVVDHADEIKVVLKDGKTLKGTVVGRDEATDLAVVKVEGHNFPYVSFENSAKPRVGDWVIAIGNPYGLGNTATAGIVSAYGRDIGDSFVDFIQIDAPINRGNSGGPTFDIYGRVIGVNSQIFTPWGGSIGIGFAIPSD